MDLIIRNGNVVLPDGVKQLSIGITGGQIVELAEGLQAGAREIDALGLHVFPGLIDSHVHFNDPGRSDWEGIETGSSALAAGGGTCFFDMPLNSSPPTLDGPSFDAKLARAQASSLTDFALWGGLTPKNLDRMEELASRGVVGFKAFMSGSGIDDFDRADDLTLYRGMRIAKALDLPVAVHAESEEITSKLTSEIYARGGRGIEDYLASRPAVAEVEAIQRAIVLAEETRCRLHIVHVSTPRGVQLVRRAATSGLCDVTCETCPHYLLLNEQDLRKLGAPAKCAPPLRSAAINENHWQDLSQGKIAFVASDHSPAPESMKQSDDFFKVWGGIAGVQSTLPILLSHEPPLPSKRVALLTATNVARRYRIRNKGQIALRMDADFALVDLNASFELKREMLLDRHKLSPYVGRMFRGMVKRTIVRGQTVFADGTIVSKPMGRLIKPG
jgi:allantoinase